MWYLKTKLKGIILIIVVIILISQINTIEGKEVIEKDIPEYRYETDYVSVECVPRPANGADLSAQGMVRLNANGEQVAFSFNLEPLVDVDTNLPAILTVIWYRADANNDTLSITEGIWTYPVDGGVGGSTLGAGAVQWGACVADRWMKKEIIITGFEAGYLLRGIFQLTEAGREIWIETISLKYHIKRYFA